MLSLADIEQKLLVDDRLIEWAERSQFASKVEGVLIGWSVSLDRDYGPPISTSQIITPEIRVLVRERAPTQAMLTATRKTFACYIDRYAKRYPKILKAPSLPLLLAPYYAAAYLVEMTEGTPDAYSPMDALSLAENALLGQVLSALAIYHIPVPTYLIKHPVIRSVVLADEAGRLFRITESNDAERVDGELMRTPAKMWVAHRTQLSDADREDWSQVFADYGIISPFKQLQPPDLTPPSMRQAVVDAWPALKFRPSVTTKFARDYLDSSWKVRNVTMRSYTERLGSTIKIVFDPDVAELSPAEWDEISRSVSA
jgi:hypothetical protein